ncbi:hypothetical protein CY34DRAFT_62856, partial [Suillus luteus UH-Slu-Lm8-n1]
LAQRRSRRIGVPMPVRYRQYDDVLPQPPPSVPSSQTQQPEFITPANSTDTSIRVQPSSRAPPFRTARNVFGLVRQFFTSTPPSHDPEEVVTLLDISSVPVASPAEIPAKLSDMSFHPYPNRSSFELGHWYWNGGVQKSQQSFKELVDIVGRPDYDPDDVRNTPWDKINSQLGASAEVEDRDEWEDEDAGWHKTQVTIEVPFSRTTPQPDVRPYVAANLYHRSLVSVIREKLANTQDDELFHYEPYQLQWCPPHLEHEVNIQGELYTSPAFMDAHRALQESPREIGCDLPRVVVALMFWSDATHLTNFGNSKLWPVYMYFGNESKYRRCKPSCHLANHVAYFQKLPDSFKDFTGAHTQGKGVGRECTTHCHRELFQAQWRVLLDPEFLEAYQHGIVILCCDGVRRRFYPRIFTYSADYPEKVLIATIRQLGGCPCPRCLVPMREVQNLGTSYDRKQRAILARSDASRSKLVATARGFIYNMNRGVDSTAVESLLKPHSWVPTSNAFSDCLGPLGFNVFAALVVDLLHEFELGVWRMLLVHLLRILCALDKDLINELDKRFRQVPPFGRATIRRFSANTSEMSNMAARNFEDLLQCSIPVFDGLFPSDHNKMVMDLLFTMAHWHGLAKLRMHSDLTLQILDKLTTDLGDRFREFKAKVCPAYKTQELDREVDSRSRRQTKEASKRAEKGKAKANVQSRRRKSFNFQTYKFHSLGDYVASIRQFGTTDSYSTEPGELEHRTPKSRYCRTDRKAFVRQLTQIERLNETTSDPQLHHYIGQSEKIYDDFGYYLRSHAKDPAMKDFLPRLKTHILDRLEPGETTSHLDQEFNSILFKRNRIYHHMIARFNFTTYDVRRAQDSINPRTPHCNIMLLKHRADSNQDDHDANYRYAKVLGIHHVNVVRAGNVYKSRRLDFLSVRWYESVQSHIWEACTLGRVRFMPITNPNAFGFVDPGDVLRACHMIPAFSLGQRNPSECGMSALAGDKHDWREYYVNSFADRDTVMRFHYGLGVGHVYSHEARIVEPP